ncbi:hypothetical protein ILUMI_10322 [Ignelater luminosus]|uniref:Uncharacterized protein n=1 Tax=Ignelater luminosus TaxID=2038154 RepID=A0A8K0GDR2_IGNLU|nr:hypothetical protein ILUMI_10322 [Ignelater luminosus]
MSGGLRPDPIESEGRDPTIPWICNHGQKKKDITNDLKLFKKYLSQKASELVLKPADPKNDRSTYLTLLETVFCRVILLNRRRPGELQRMYLHTYETSGYKATYEEFNDLISPAEKILLKHFKRVVTRAKRGRGVTFLFTLEVQDHIEQLEKCRENFVSKDNPFLFALPNSSSPIYGYKVLRKHALACSAKNPDALTATRL